MSAPAPAKKNDRAVPSTGPEATGTSMRAHVGDEIVVRGTTAGGIARDGEIVGLHHPDGSPPYDVRWAENGRATLYFPGPDAYIRHPTSVPHPAGPSADTSSAPDELVTGGSHVPAR
ncbi:DUF1918 domain-containing protein [Streptomyces sp. NBC_00365]|uniref:DUF1918 domain-containing protein n=1 Tax=Streptomyces sp. NBC_00365 TaxID=2975726 RepID=UPI002258EA5D|nr:DUF1918 domain-containing protein [Streptomyces sp. NBC_00365]MCX5095953.1 DUF1918 domain-containing protein [Streptomyces sp. NBC_00365]